MRNNDIFKNLKRIANSLKVHIACTKQNYNKIKIMNATASVNFYNISNNEIGHVQSNQITCSSSTFFKFQNGKIKQVVLISVHRKQGSGIR